MATFDTMDCVKANNHVIKVAPIDYSAQAEQRDKNGATAAILFGKFMDYTTSHGFGHVKRIESRTGKSIWALLTLAGTCVAIWQIYTVINAYYKHDYNTLMDIKFDTKAKFPVVTICNLNPYR